MKSYLSFIAGAGLMAGAMLSYYGNKYEKDMIVSYRNGHSDGVIQGLMVAKKCYKATVSLEQLGVNIVDLLNIAPCTK
jgi:hypothetical protein